MRTAGSSESGEGADGPYHLYFEDRGEYIFARVVAARCRSGRRGAFSRRLSRTLRFSRNGRLLIDNKVVVMPPDDEIFEIADHVVALMPGVKIAFVDDDIRLA
jgi:hypothetical protein